MVKLDLDTVPTVPDAPPAAGPDRALDPPPPGPGAPAGRLPGTGGAVEAEEDVARPTESPITGDITAVASSNRRTIRRRGRLSAVTEADPSGKDVCGSGAAASARPTPSEIDRTAAALNAEGAAEVLSVSAGSQLFMILLFFLIEATHNTLPGVHVSSLQATCIVDRSLRGPPRKM
jgi:hypothetical protein